MHSLCSAALNISQNIIFNTVLFVKHLCLHHSLSIRRLTGWRGFGERLAAVSTWILGNWFQNKIVAPEAEFLDEIQTKVLKGPKLEIFGFRVFSQIRPVWVGDLGTRQNNSKF
jgi:hypothetical protein